MIFTNKEDLISYIEILSSDTEKIEYFLEISYNYHWLNLIILTFFYFALSNYLIKNLLQKKNNFI